MEVLKSFKIRCYPTRSQRELFARTEGACRYVYNRVLRELGESYEAKKRGEVEKAKTVIDMSREVTQWKKEAETVWLSEIPSSPLTQSLQDLGKAYANFFAGRAKYPKRHKKFYGCSIRTQLDQRQDSLRARWANRVLFYPGFGKLALAEPERMPKTLPKMITLRRDGAGRFFVSFAVPEQVEPLPSTGLAVGVDLGVKDLAVLSTGEKIPGARALRGRLKALKRSQRALSRKVKGSNRWKRQRQRIARLHARIADTRSDSLHKLSDRLTREFDVIGLEDLNVKGMLASAKGTVDEPGTNVKQKSSLSRNIADQGFSEFRRQVEYKAGWRGKVVLYAPRFAPTTKACSECGCIQPPIPMKIRSWVCPDCGAEHDRDVNAAKNILSISTAGNAGSYARRERNDPPLTVQTVSERRSVKREPKLGGHGTERPEREAA